MRRTHGARDRAAVHPQTHTHDTFPLWSSHRRSRVCRQGAKTRCTCALAHTQVCTHSLSSKCGKAREGEWPRGPPRAESCVSHRLFRGRGATAGRLGLPASPFLESTPTVCALGASETRAEPRREDGGHGAVPALT